ncbi:hypothetical protein [uncultured Tateyamaria sp.]|uniref:hypothetical protein n=1 Tax=Tateyamaria sp. 1078 TaxID=3417464 RepID=UPI002630470A|nr:hypothetical protein [uncultured Tateyamaria sp.]
MSRRPAGCFIAAAGGGRQQAKGLRGTGKTVAFRESHQNAGIGEVTDDRAIFDDAATHFASFVRPRLHGQGVRRAGQHGHQLVQRADHARTQGAVPYMDVIDRPFVNICKDQVSRVAVDATGQKKLVI